MSVDDITTAIETGWKMLGETSPPTISFHKDTKLLIAVGEPSKLETIDAVLKAWSRRGHSMVATRRESRSMRSRHRSLNLQRNQRTRNNRRQPAHDGPI